MHEREADFSKKKVKGYFVEGLLIAMLVLLVVLAGIPSLGNYLDNKSFSTRQALTAP